MKPTVPRSQSVASHSVRPQVQFWEKTLLICQDTGANASAEEAGDDVDDNKQTVLDVVHSFRLNETQFDKKSYLSHLKSM